MLLPDQGPAREFSPKKGDQYITTLGDDARAKDVPEGIVVMLRVVEGEEPGKGYPIDKTPATIGRDDMCDITIVDKRMSRQHAMLFYYSPNFYVKDLGSTNGTFVNDKKITQAAVKNGDRVKTGNTLLELIVSPAVPRTIE